MYGMLHKIFIIYVYYVTLLYRIRNIGLVSNLKLLLYLLYVLQKQPELDIFSRAGDYISKIFLAISGDIAHIAWSRIYRPGMSALLLGDAYRVEQVISNLPSSFLRCTAPFIRVSVDAVAGPEDGKETSASITVSVYLGRRPWYIQRELGESL